MSPESDIILRRKAAELVFPAEFKTEFYLQDELPRKMIHGPEATARFLEHAVEGGMGAGGIAEARRENMGMRILSIGVDSNQNYLHPGKVLTSMMKRVDVAVYNAFSDGADMQSGAIGLNLANEGVGYAMDEHNADLVSADMIAAVEAAKASIILGDLAVHDYMSDNSCPVLNF